MLYVYYFLSSLSFAATVSANILIICFTIAKKGIKVKINCYRLYLAYKINVNKCGKSNQKLVNSK